MYWRRWSAVSRALNWRMVQGRLDPAAAQDGSSHIAAVMQAASARAAGAHRAVTPDDLRHGCHLVALGRDKSHADFSNREFDKLLTLWGDEKQISGLLLEPLDLGSEIHRANPELKSRERHLHFLRRDCLGGYVASESERIFGTKNWQALDSEQLAQLSNHLRARPNVLRKAPAGAEDPDWTV